jgi:hypothetical protein
MAKAGVFAEAAARVWPKTSPLASPGVSLPHRTRGSATATSSSAGGWWGRSSQTSLAGRRRRRDCSSPLESSPRRRKRSARPGESAGSGLDV